MNWLSQMTKSHVPTAAHFMELFQPQRHDWRIQTFPTSAFLQPHDKSVDTEFITDNCANDMWVS